MAGPSSIPVPSDTERLRQEHRGLDMESIDEDLALSRRDVAAANYRGIALPLFALSAAGFALVAATIACGVAVAILAFENGRLNERVSELNAAVSAKAAQFDTVTIQRVSCEAQLQRMDGLLDRARK